jgi:hypothetical protein
LVLSTGLAAQESSAHSEHGHQTDSIRLTPKAAPGGRSKSTIDFRHLYSMGPQAPELSQEALALQGKRVTFVGFMANMDQPPKGGFYLAPYPVIADESGAGRGSLPPTSVLVVTAAAKGKVVAFLPGPLEVSGRLDLGNKESEDGEIATIRLVVDDPRDLKFAQLAEVSKKGK